MTIIQAFTGALGGTFADQWKDIITADRFNEHTAVAPGVLRKSNNNRGVNDSGSVGVISNGSKIFVPERTAAFIFDQDGIEAVITEPGGYEYQNGQDSIFNRDGVRSSFVDQIASRISFGGQTSDQKKIAFINLREIRGIKFGTRGPLVYNDHHYGADLEIKAFGTFSLQIVDVFTFVRNFIPANTFHYNFASRGARAQLLSEFIQSFTVALNSLSSTYRVSQLPSQAQEIATQIASAGVGAGRWKERFGLEIMHVGIENIELTPESRELVRQYSANRMSLQAYEGVAQQSSNISAQQKIAGGIEDHGLGDGGGMLFGMNLAQGMNPMTGVQTPAVAALSFDEQVETLKKMKDLMDSGILTEQEFETKKREIMGL